MPILPYLGAGSVPILSQMEGEALERNQEEQARDAAVPSTTRPSPESDHTPGGDQDLRASVVVPARNAASTLGTCLKALLTQDIPPNAYEIIVVDDGSTDSTPDIARQSAVRLLQSEHRGPAAARNLGAKSARAPILLFTDADCSPSKDWIREMILQFGDDSRNVIGVKGEYRTHQRELVARFVQIEYEEKYDRMSHAGAIDFVDTYSAGYRRNIFLANGGFDESFPSASVEDQELSFRLSEQGHLMLFAPKAIVYHRHVDRLFSYVRRKFRIGYWKVRLHRRHPGKMWKDSHTPPTLKLEVALFSTSALSLVPAFLIPYAWLLTLWLILVFGLTSIPLVLFAARRDRSVALIAPLIILVRAAALSAGLAAGILGEVTRSAHLKRLLDIVGAAFGLIIFAPIMLMIAIAIKLDSPGPVLFRQVRAGHKGNPFTIIKFRSMVDGAEDLLDRVIAANCLQPPVFKIPNDPRVTRVGRFLRRFSLDELPQFVNVLRGEMSLVGPRPEELRIVALYGEQHLRRVEAKPGMTGPMQTEGRGGLSLDDRLRLEIDYIEGSSIWEDLILIARTLPAVIRGRGAF